MDPMPSPSTRVGLAGVRGIGAIAIASAVVSLGGATATAATPWAGLTQAQAIGKAKRDVIAVGLSIGTLTSAQVPTFRHELDSTKPGVTPVRCRNGMQAWKILWPKSDPVYEARSGLQLECLKPLFP